MRYLPHEAWGPKCFFRRSYEGLNHLFKKWVGLNFSTQVFFKVAVCGHYVFVPFFLPSSFFFLFLFFLSGILVFILILANFFYAFLRNGWQKRTGLSFQWFPVENWWISFETDPQQISVFKPVQSHLTREILSISHQLTYRLISDCSLMDQACCHAGDIRVHMCIQILTDAVFLQTILNGNWMECSSMISFVYP